MVTDPGDTPLKMQQLLTEEEYRAARDTVSATARSRPTWAPRPSASCWSSLDLVKLSEELRAGADRDQLASRRRRT